MNKGNNNPPLVSGFPLAREHLCSESSLFTLLGRTAPPTACPAVQSHSEAITSFSSPPPGPLCQASRACAGSHKSASSPGRHEPPTRRTYTRPGTPPGGASRMDRLPLSRDQGGRRFANPFHALMQHRPTRHLFIVLQRLPDFPFQPGHLALAGCLDLSRQAFFQTAALLRATPPTASSAGLWRTTIKPV